MDQGWNPEPGLFHQVALQGIDEGRHLGGSQLAAAGRPGDLANAAGQELPRFLPVKLRSLALPRQYSTDPIRSQLGNLFLQGHTAEQIIDPFFDGETWITETKRALILRLVHLDSPPVRYCSSSRFSKASSNPSQAS